MGNPRKRPHEEKPVAKQVAFEDSEDKPLGKMPWDPMWTKVKNIQAMKLKAKQDKRNAQDDYDRKKKVSDNTEESQYLKKLRTSVDNKEIELNQMKQTLNESLQKQQKLQDDTADAKRNFEIAKQEEEFFAEEELNGVQEAKEVVQSFLAVGNKMLSSLNDLETPRDADHE